MATNPRGVMLIQDETSGQWLGEVCRLHDGRWSALRYGPEARSGGVIVADAEAAEQHVRKLADSMLHAGSHCKGDANGCTP